MFLSRKRAQRNRSSLPWQAPRSSERDIGAQATGARGEWFGGAAMARRHRWDQNPRQTRDMRAAKDSCGWASLAALELLAPGPAHLAPSRPTGEGALSIPMNVDPNPDWRVVIAYSEPPASFHFTPAKSGKAWFRMIEGEQWARELARQLVALDIHGVIKRCEPPKPSSRPSGGRKLRAKTTREGFGGALNALPIRGYWRMRKKGR